MNAQQTLGFAPRFVEPVRPYAEGDYIVKANGAKYVVTRVEVEAYAEPALVCISKEHGGDAIVFFREVSYRTNVW